jgi:hypothetical protein
MEVSGHLNVPGETATGTHYIGQWVGPRASLDVLKKCMLALPGMNPRLLCCSANSLVTVLTELSQLRNRNMYVPEDVCRHHDYGEAMAKKRNTCKRLKSFGILNTNPEPYLQTI